jgi:hypothetical protein
VGETADQADPGNSTRAAAGRSRAQSALVFVVLILLGLLPPAQASRGPAFVPGGDAPRVEHPAPRDAKAIFRTQIRLLDGAALAESGNDDNVPDPAAVPFYAGWLRFGTATDGPHLPAFRDDLLPRLRLLRGRPQSPRAPPLPSAA